MTQPQTPLAVDLRHWAAPSSRGLPPGGPGWLRIDADSTLVVLSGELDRLEARRLAELLEGALATGTPHVVADLGRTTFVDVAAARTILRWAIEAQAAGRRVRVVRAPRLLPAMAELLGVAVTVVPAADPHRH